jgi:hypothetical protein
MTAVRACVLLGSAMLLLDGCSRSKDIDIGLDPPSFTIVTGESSTTGSGSILVEPNALGGSSYADNRADIEDVSLKSLRLEVVSINAENLATELRGFSLAITDTETLVRHDFVSALPSVAIGVRDYDLGLIAPANPTTDNTSIDDFLGKILKDGHSFVVLATATVDQVPVNLTCKLHFDIELHVKVSWP